MLKILWILLACALAGASAAAPVRSTAAEAELVAAQIAVVAGTTLELGLRIKLDPEWHVYWKNAGDSGSPPTLTLELPVGFKAGALEFAWPKRIPVAHLVNFGYEGEVLFPVRVEVPSGIGGTIAIRARADWLECKESCLPAGADLALELPVATTTSGSRWQPLFAATRARIPIALPEGASASAVANAEALTLSIAGVAQCSNADFFPEREGHFVHARIARTAGSTLAFLLPLETNARTPDPLEGVLVCDGERGFSLRAALGSPATSSLSLAVALAFAFAGGLLLNLMPCVFPILGLKLLGLADTQRRADRVGHALRFFAGVLTGFIALAATMLALRAAGESVGWGFQLQSPAFVAAIAVLFFVLALNLSGVFEWGAGLQSAAGQAAARWGGAFADGVLAAAIASPCTAPLMGAAIGFTLAEPAPKVLAVFAALALGMALPYMILVVRRDWTRRLPRPGPWLETLRGLLAFPLYATTLWLGWVLGELAGLDALVALGVVLLAVALALWLGAGRVRTSIAALLVAGALVWLHGAIAPAPTQAPTWQPWSPAAFAAARAEGRPIFVDFTAAWCVTCQVNKHAVLHTPAVERALAATGTLALRADWTRQDAEITRALAALGRNGVPVYAVYDRQGRVQLLPEILTPARVIDALSGG